MQVRSHQHKTFDIKPLGECRACDDYHERRGLTREELDDAFFAIFPHAGAARILRMMDDVDHERHEELVDMIGQGVALADAVDDAMGEWPGHERGNAGQADG